MQPVIFTQIVYYWNIYCIWTWLCKRKRRPYIFCDPFGLRTRSQLTLAEMKTKVTKRNWTCVLGRAPCMKGSWWLGTLTGIRNSIHARHLLTLELWVFPYIVLLSVDPSILHVRKIWLPAMQVLFKLRGKRVPLTQKKIPARLVAIGNQSDNWLVPPHPWANAIIT